MKKILILCVLILGLTASGGPALAAPPPAPRPGPPELAEGSGLFPAATATGGYCQFDVNYDLTGKSKLIVTKEGRTVTSPGQKITLCTDTTSVSYVITGVRRDADTIDPQGGKVIEIGLTGINLVYNSTDSANQGLFLLVGNYNYALNDLGNNEFSENRVFSGTGQATDICAVLDPAA
jgi:hypothetical protein